MDGTDRARRLESRIRTIPDFPKPGIQFKDITTLLAHGPSFREAIGWMAEQAREREVDRVAGAEARGFIFGAALAYELEIGFIPIRKPGKLPHETVEVEYALEYGTDAVQMHVDAVAPGERILLVDDLLATGGTMKACGDLVEREEGQVVGCLFLIELGFLGGRGHLDRWPVESLIVFDGE